MRRWFLLIPSLLILAGFFLWWNRPAQVVKRKSVSLLKTVTLDADDGRIGRGLRSNDLASYLAANVDLQTPIPAASGTFSRSQLESGFSWFCQHATSTEFKIQSGPMVQIEGDTATSSMEVMANGVIPGYNLPSGAYAVSFVWVRGQDGWQLTKAEWIPH